MGRRFDARLLADSPAGIDPCDERAGFASAIEFEQGEVVERDGFAWVDLIPR